MPQWVTSNYKRGDLIIFDFVNTSSVTDHIEILESISGSILTTIGGNTSSGSSGSQSNGDGVYRRTRRLSDVHGAYRPDYTSSMTADKVIAVAQGEIGYTETGNNNNKYGIAYGLNNQPWCVIFVWWCFRQSGMSSLFCGGAKVADCASVKRYAQNNSTYTSTATETKSTPKSVLSITAKAQLVSTDRKCDSGVCKSLQILLVQKGYASFTPDGICGAKTDAAIRAFQKAKGLTVDGQAGADTWTALIKA